MVSSFVILKKTAEVLITGFFFENPSQLFGHGFYVVLLLVSCKNVVYCYFYLFEEYVVKVKVVVEICFSM